MSISKDRLFSVFFQFLKFGIVGVSNTLISYLIYSCLVYIGCNYVLASIAGFIVSVLNSFYWNNKYVFAKGKNENRSLLFALGKCFVAYGVTGLLLQNFLLILCVETLHISKYIAPLPILIVTVPLNFVINKIWAFSSKKKDSSCEEN